MSVEEFLDDEMRANPYHQMLRDRRPPVAREGSHGLTAFAEHPDAQKQVQPQESPDRRDLREGLVNNDDAGHVKIVLNDETRDLVVDELDPGQYWVSLRLVCVMMKLANSSALEEISEVLFYLFRRCALANVTPDNGAFIFQLWLATTQDKT